MIRVNVGIKNISAERFWDIKKPIPPIQIGTNINIVGMDKKDDETVEVPFVLTINYNPAIAQISLKGSAYISGDKEEIEKVIKEHKEKRPPPPLVVQSISNVVFIESVLISRTLNIPPPIPLPQIPQTKAQGSKPKGRDYSA
ncbi:hypothetical protein E2P61_05615 [Candidatus Bathyarchaeota archaeon]|nr:hypothetical protein E2P61_05615 [Candidatus Bathyarchaeota archaeon]